MTRGNYKTKQKDIILDIIKRFQKEFTIKELYDEISSTTSLTTVYRFVDKLIEDGVLNKTIGQDHNAYYQYIEKCDCTHHFYLKCEKCGSLTHIECNFVEDLVEHITSHHKFLPNSDHIMINGICHKCSKGGI